MAKKGKKWKPPKKKQKEEPSYRELIEMYDELDQLKQEHPDIVKEVNPKLAKPTLMERLMQFYLYMREHFHAENYVNKKAYCWLCLLGPFGAHHFYSKHWIKGLIYLAISWSGISTAMAMIDWMVAYPKEPDKFGMIVI